MRRGPFSPHRFGRTASAPSRPGAGWLVQRLIATLAVLAVLALDVVVVSGPAYAATAPGAPTATTATAGNTQVGLSWVAPASTGGAAITDYRVQYKLSSASTWSTFADGTSTAVTATVTGLTNASAYSFQVAAINSVGAGTYSATVAATPKATVPGAVTALSATAGNTQLGLAWTAPASTGGAAITDYQVQFKLTSASTWTTFADGTSTATTATVTGLVNGSSYTVRVAAINAVGTGAYSSTITATPAATAAGAPTALTGTAGNTQVGLSWVAPVSTGGAAITDYQVQYKLGSAGTWTTFADGTSTAVSATVTGLVNGSSYDLRVAAINAAGTGMYATTVSATPRTVPAAPTGLSALPGNTQLVLSWTAPTSTGGAAVTDYQVQYKLGAASTWTTFADGTSTATATTVTGLVNGSSYNLRVAAINAAGSGTVSASATATPQVMVSSVVTGLSAAPGSARVSLVWTAPANSGASAITDYQVQYKLGSASTWSTFADGISTGTGATVTGLVNGSSYSFQVAAINSSGTGASSAAVTGVPHASAALRAGLTPAQAPSRSQTVAISTAAVSTVAAIGTGALQVIDGYAYVGDKSMIKRVDLDTGDVAVMAGDGSAGWQDSSAGEANPVSTLGSSVTAMANDGAFLYFIDYYGVPSLRKMDLDTGYVTTLIRDNTTELEDVTVGPGGGLYVSTPSQVLKVDTATKAMSVVATLPNVDSTNHTRLSADSAYLWVLTLSTSYSTSLVRVDPGTGAITSQPVLLPAGFDGRSSGRGFGRLVSAGDYLYVAGGYRVNRITKTNGETTGIAGSSRGYLDGAGAQAWFKDLSGIDSDGTSLFVSDSDYSGTGRLRKLVLGTPLMSQQPANWSATLNLGPVDSSVLAGSGAATVTDGTGTTASFSSPVGLKIIDGWAYTFDVGYLRRVNLASGRVETVGGLGDYDQADNQDPHAALVGLSASLTSDGTFLYWSESGPNTIRRMSLSSGAISTVVKPSTSLDIFRSLTIGPDGFLYAGNGETIQRINPITGAWSTFLTMPESMGTGYNNIFLTADSTSLWFTTDRICSTGLCQTVGRIDPVSGDMTIVANYAGEVYGRFHNGLVSAGDYLYAEVEYNGGADIGIRRIKKSDGSTILVTTQHVSTSVNVSLDVNGSTLYLTDPAGHQVVKMVQAPPTGPSGAQAWGGSNLSMDGRCLRCEGEPVDLDTGAQFDATTDIAIPGRGIPLAFARTYDTRRKTLNGRLGYGWSDSYDWKLTTDTSSAPSAGDITIRQDNGSQVVFHPNGIGGYVADSDVLSALVKNPDGSWAYTVRQATTYLFNAEGRLTGERDRNGYLTTLAYDGSGRLWSVTDPAGRSLMFTYDSSNHIQTITDSAARVLTYTYDGNGDLTQASNLAGGHWDLAYDAHLLTVMADPRGNTVNTTYVGDKVSQQADRRGKVTRFDYGTYDAAGGHITTVTHPGGNKDTHAYVGGRVMSETKGTGTSVASTTSYTYDLDTNAVKTVTDNAGHTMTYTSDARGNQLSSVDPLGRQTSATYNAFNQPLTTTDSSSVTTTMTYDPAGRLLSVSRPLIGTTPLQSSSSTFTYGDPANPGRPGDLMSTTDANGKTTSFTYDQYGNQTSVTDPTGRTTTSTYNSLDWLTATISPEGTQAGGNPAAHTTTYGDFTGTGQPRDIRDALLHHTYLVYDNNGNQTDATDTESRHSVTTYDGENHPTRTTLNTVMTSTTQYDDNGNVVTQGDGLDHLTKYEYDALNRPRIVTDPLLHTTKYGYDNAGNRTTITDADNQTSVTAYDAAGHATSSTDAENRLTSYGYDTLGRLATVTDAQGRVTKTTFDSLGRRTNTAQGTTTQLTAGTLPVTGSWTYDKVGNVLTGTDGTTGTTTYTPDDAGRTTAVQDPLGRLTTLDYDQDGNTKTITRPGPAITTNTYDALDRLTGIDYPTGTPDVTYGYDTTGLRTSMNDGTGTTAYTYTTSGQLKSTTNGTTAVGYDYDAAGRQTSITYPGTGHTLTRAYDNADRLKSVTDWASRVTNYTWNDDNTLHDTTLPNGVATTYAYDNTNLPTKILATNASTTVSDLRYTYDNTSLLTAVSDMTTPTTPINHGYTFDSRGRLDTTTGASNAGDYDFDNSNRLTGALAATYTFDTGGQFTASTTPAVGVTAARSATYAYNTHGDRTQTVTTPAGGTATTRTYGYDAIEHLTSYTDTATPGPSLAYTYDGDGLRAGKTRTVTGPTTTTQAYTWDTSGSLPVLLTDSDNHYLYGPDNHPYAQINTTTGTITYLQADHAGSTIATTDNTGTRTATWDYDPYGNITAHTGTATTPFLYTGEYRDTDTGLTYLRARDYDPATGTFLTRDPLFDTTHSPYAYTNGNPLLTSDPTGLISTGLCAGGSIGAFIGGFVQACIVVAVDIRSGKVTIGDTETAGGGVYVFPIISAGATGQLTTANNISQLGGAAHYAGFGIGEAVGGSVDFSTSEVCGAPGNVVAGVDVSLRGALSIPVVPFDVHAGETRTAAHTRITLDPVGWGRGAVNALKNIW